MECLASSQLCLEGGGRRGRLAGSGCGPEPGHTGPRSLRATLEWGFPLVPPLAQHKHSTPLKPRSRPLQGFHLSGSSPEARGRHAVSAGVKRLPADLAAFSCPRASLQTSEVL